MSGHLSWVPHYNNNNNDDGDDNAIQTTGSGRQRVMLYTFFLFDVYLYIFLKYFFKLWLIKI